MSNKQILVQLLSLFYCCILILQCTNNRTPIPTAPDEMPKHIFPIRFSEEIKKGLTDNTIRPARATSAYSFIGNYQEAMKTTEVELLWGLDTMTVEDKNYFEQFKPKDAFEYLAEATKNEQIVIISEAHQKPQHRIFTRRMLKDLYKNGFRYLGLETLTPNPMNPEALLFDTLLNERGYPLFGHLTGTYTGEPQMGNLVREAIEIGFELFAYERIRIKGQKKEDRDLMQARNIKKFIDAHPNGKVLIHCGWYHAIESDFPKRKTNHWMAHYLKRDYGINPFTIYQDALTEKAKGKESPYFQAVDSDKIAVLMNYNGDVFNSKKNGAEHFDVHIYHPRTKYVKGRPNWLTNYPNNRLLPLQSFDIPIDQFPILYRAFAQKDTNLATPMDVVEVLQKDDLKPLVLPKGRYKIEVVLKSKKRFTYQEEVQ